MDPASENRHVRERQDTLSGAETIRILHVDDDPDFADLVSIYLEREGESLEVVTETSAEAGLDRLATEDIDCVVSDYDMPGMDGLEFLDAVREKYADLPFILFTGKGSEEIASEAISAGVTDYLQKIGGTEQYAVLANRIKNVTQQHRAEQEVERSFQVIETAREGIAFLDEEGTFVYVNPAYTDVYGYDREELLGEHWSILYPEEHVSQVYEDILPSVPKQGHWTGENIHIRKNGERLLVDHALAYTDDGTLLCFIEDITEEKETHRTLERERQRFELFVDAVEEYAIFSLDTEGYVTSWNRGAERLKGYSQAEILGQHFSVFYPEAQVEAGRPDELLEQALDEGSVRDTGWRVREDDSRFWANVVITAVFDEEGRHRGYLKVTQDLTEQYEEQQRFEPEDPLLERALNVLEDMFFMLDATGNMVRVTDRTTEVTGYSREELLSMAPSELFAPDDRPRVQDAIGDVLTEGKATFEVDILTKDGRRIPYESRARRLTDDAGNTFIVGVGWDISRRKRRERQLERQLAQFEHFGSVLSHDLRTPLNTAMGRVELARETGNTEQLRQADVALDRLNELVDDLANVMQEGEFVNEMTTLDIGEQFRSVWETLDTAEATLTIDSSGAIRADEEALTRLAENLLKNALEHGGSEVTVTVGALPDGFYVEDDGPGIPEEERTRVFEMGYSTKEGDSRSGLGLASVKQLVVAHGWEITATESDTGGARFEITDVEVVE